VLRVAGIATPGEKGDKLRLNSFQVLSYAAPLIWYGFRWYNVRSDAKHIIFTG
jgi:hypothetical protein